MSVTQATLLGDSLGTSSSGTIPVGGIIMWSGTIANIPIGWSLCNGNGGTPNLQDKFIVGAGSGYAPGNTGGAASVTLDVTQMPAHSHNMDYQQKAVEDTGTAQVSDMRFAGGDGDGGSQNYSDQSGNIRTAGGLNGITQAHENRPPYYALAFIMRGS